MFVATNTFVMTKHVFYCDKCMLVMTKLLLQQNDVCLSKHTFVMTKDVFCHDKTVVVTKMTLVAAPAHDRRAPCQSSRQILELFSKSIKSRIASL